MKFFPGFTVLRFVVLSWCFQGDLVTCLDDIRHQGSMADYTVNSGGDRGANSFNPTLSGKTSSNLDLNLVSNPTLEQTANLAECARNCQERPACKIFLFAIFKPHDFNCGFGYNDSDSSKTSDSVLKHFLYFQMENRTAPGLEYDSYCHTYIHLNDTLGESRKISLSTSSRFSNCPIGFGTSSKSRIKIHIECTGDCHGEEQWLLHDVIRHHVTTNGSRHVLMEEGVSTCFNAVTQKSNLTFLTSTGRFMLLDVQTIGLFNRTFLLDVTTVNENDVCSDCYYLDAPSGTSDVIACPKCNLTEGLAVCRNECCNDIPTAASMEENTTTAAAVSDSTNAIETATTNVIDLTPSSTSWSTKDLDVVSLPTYHGGSLGNASVKTTSTPGEITTDEGRGIDTNMTSNDVTNAMEMDFDVSSTEKMNITTTSTDDAVTGLSDEQKDDNTATIGGAVGGALAGLALISAVLGFLICHRAKNKVSDMREEPSEYIEME